MKCLMRRKRRLPIFLERNTWPAVIKADGLALGKGVVIAQDEAEAKDALHAMMEDKFLAIPAAALSLRNF